MCACRPLPWCYAIFNLRLKACFCVDIQVYIVMDKYSFKFLMIKNWSVKEWSFHCKLTTLSELFSWKKIFIYVKKNIYFHENNSQKVNSTTALFPLMQAVFMWFEIKKGAYTPPISLCRQLFETYFISSWRANSQMTIPVVTLTFNECLVPNCGISRQPSLISTTLCFTPFTSLPSTIA